MILCVILAFVGVVVGIVAVTPEKKPPLPYKLGEEFDLPPYKWQLDAVVEASAGGTLDQAKLEALARYIAAWKQDTLGKVERWWISYYLPGSGDRGPVALVKWEKGKLEFQWVPMNYPPGFKGPAMEQGK